MTLPVRKGQKERDEQGQVQRGLIFRCFSVSPLEGETGPPLAREPQMQPARGFSE